MVNGISYTLLIESTRSLVLVGCIRLEMTLKIVFHAQRPPIAAHSQLTAPPVTDSDGQSTIYR